MARRSTQFNSLLFKQATALHRDSTFVYELRNDPIIRMRSRMNQDFIPFSNHLAWYHKHFQEFFLVSDTMVVGGAPKVVPIGYGRLHPVTKDIGVISFALKAEYRARGIGGWLVEQLLKEAQRKRIRQCSAVAHRTNYASQAVLKTNGFHDLGPISQESEWHTLTKEFVDG